MNIMKRASLQSEKDLENIDIHRGIIELFTLFLDCKEALIMKYLSPPLSKKTYTEQLQRVLFGPLGSPTYYNIKTKRGQSQKKTQLSTKIDILGRAGELQTGQTKPRG